MKKTTSVLLVTFALVLTVSLIIIAISLPNERRRIRHSHHHHSIQASTPTECSTSYEVPVSSEICNYSDYSHSSEYVHYSHVESSEHCDSNSPAFCFLSFQHNNHFINLCCGCLPDCDFNLTASANCKEDATIWWFRQKELDNQIVYNWCVTSDSGLIFKVALCDTPDCSTKSLCILPDDAMSDQDPHVLWFVEKVNNHKGTIKSVSSGEYISYTNTDITFSNSAVDVFFT